MFGGGAEKISWVSVYWPRIVKVKVERSGPGAILSSLYQGNQRELHIQSSSFSELTEFDNKSADFFRRFFSDY
jgi:hypothetical protein